jgi:hypothetical protein
MSIQKSEINLVVNGKPPNAYLVSPSGSGPGVLVLPSWFGLKPYFKQVCDRLAEHESDPYAMGAMVKAAKDHLASLRRDKPVAFVGFSMGTDWATSFGKRHSTGPLM